MSHLPTALDDGAPPMRGPSSHGGRSAVVSGAQLSLDRIVALLEEHGQIGYWWHDAATDRVTISAGLARINGVPASVMHTRDGMLRSIHPQDRPYQDDHIGLADSGQPLRREFRVVRPDGTIRWVSLHVDVVLSDDGRPGRSSGVGADVTDRREAQRVVEFNQERRTALLEAISATTWVVDAAGRFSDDRGWCALTGMTPDGCSDEGWLDAVHPADRGRVRASFRASLERNDPFDEDCRILTRQGEYRRYNARHVPVRDPSGVIREWQGVLLPIAGHQPSAADQAVQEDPPSLSGAQIRGARGLLDWSLAQLAAASGVSVSTIKRMEDGNEGSTRASKSDAVRRALQAGGIAFRTIDGVTWISR